MSIAKHIARIVGGAYDNAGDKAGFMAARSYRYWRARGRTASDALRLARADAEAENARYDESAAMCAEGERGGRWCERPEAIGLRFVGFSDEILSGRRGVDHNGWFLYPDGDPGEVARGAVYQLPARGGRPVYVEALRTGEGGWRDWRDMGEDGSALLFLNDRHLGEQGGREATGDCDALISAARGADEEARIYAEKEREYQEAWRAGADCAEKEAEAKEERKAARELARELRAILKHVAPDRFRPSSFPAACATLRGAIRDHIRNASEAAEKARELADQFAPWTRPAWADSYQEKYGRDPFPNGNAEADRLASAFAEGRDQ